MGTQHSVAVRDAQADAFESTTGVSPLIKAYSGDPPANCATAASGTNLANGTLPSDWLTASSSGAKAKNGTWTLTGVALGDVGYCRIYDSTGTTCHWQGIAAQAWAASTAYVVGQHVTNGGLTYRCTTAGTSASSGGPTTTGTGITDGTAVWTYVGTTDITLDNVRVNVSQVLTVSSWAYTMGAA